MKIRAEIEITRKVYVDIEWPEDADFTLSEWAERGCDRFPDSLTEISTTYKATSTELPENAPVTRVFKMEDTGDRRTLHEIF